MTKQQRDATRSALLARSMKLIVTRIWKAGWPRSPPPAPKLPPH